MANKVLHVVFTPSGAGSLRRALKAVGRDEQVISSFDDLSFGPINSLEYSIRAKWVEDELGWTGWEDVLSQTHFWSLAVSSNHRKIAWLSKRSAKEYAGFLEWLWRLQDAPCEVIDVTDIKVSRHSTHAPPTIEYLPVSVGGLFPTEIIDNDLFGRTEILKNSARNEYHKLWQRLRTENAPLRILSSGTLVSAPITFFDALLLSHVTYDWRKVAMVVGHSLASQMDGYIFQTSDLFLAARVQALVEVGHLEVRGKSALEVLFSEVRLPQHEKR